MTKSISYCDDFKKLHAFMESLEKNTFFGTYSSEHVTNLWSRPHLKTSVVNYYIYYHYDKYVWRDFFFFIAPGI